MTHAADLAAHYARFRVSERVLLTGHSHQAWPDVAFDAHQQAWLDAARLVDDKWEQAAIVADDVREGWRRLLADSDGDIALGQNTHELLLRFLSAVLDPGRDACNRRTLVTTTGEFHTVRRQIDRLEEAGVPIVRVEARPVEDLSARLAAAISDRTAAVIVSSVLFETAEIVPGLADVAAAAHRAGAELLVDAYHHLNVVPFDLTRLGLAGAFVTGGGYKYCQLGEGNCFLRLPPGCTLRPVDTGWYSEFAELAEERTPGRVAYGQGAARFAGATYDPTAHYRAAAVFAFHQRQQLTPERLRAINQQQVQRLAAGVAALDLPPAAAVIVAMPDDRRAGFLAIRSPHAAAAVAALRERGVYADARGTILRLGPAPYVADTQLDAAVVAVGDFFAAADVNPSD